MGKKKKVNLDNFKTLRVNTNQSERICQGDIFRNIEFIEYIHEEEGDIEISKIKFPFVVVLTQDCDLSQDFSIDSDKNGDKKLISVLVAPLYNFDKFKLGEHLKKIGLTMQNFQNDSQTKLNTLLNNDSPRYHFFKFPEEIELVNSVVDFKHYFSINVKKLAGLKESNFVCRLSELYREDLSCRFSNFLSRIGLPD